MYQLALIHKFIYILYFIQKQQHSMLAYPTMHATVLVLLIAICLRAQAALRIHNLENNLNNRQFDVTQTIQRNYSYKLQRQSIQAPYRTFEENQFLSRTVPRIMQAQISQNVLINQNQKNQKVPNTSEIDNTEDPKQYVGQTESAKNSARKTEIKQNTLTQLQLQTVQNQEAQIGADGFPNQFYGYAAGIQYYQPPFPYYPSPYPVYPTGPAQPFSGLPQYLPPYPYMMPPYGYSPPGYAQPGYPPMAYNPTQGNSVQNQLQNQFLYSLYNNPQQSNTQPNPSPLPSPPFSRNPSVITGGNVPPDADIASVVKALFDQAYKKRQTANSANIKFIPTNDLGKQNVKINYQINIPNPKVNPPSSSQNKTQQKKQNIQSQQNAEPEKKKYNFTFRYSTYRYRPKRKYPTTPFRQGGHPIFEQNTRDKITDESVTMSYEDYRATYSKNPSAELTDQTLAYRRKIYNENVNLINAFNTQKQRNFNMGLNQFTDVSQQQFSKTHYLLSVEGARFLGPLQATLPPMVVTDWMCKTSPVFDQGSCGSSQVFTIVDAIEMAYKAFGMPAKNLSIQELLACHKRSRIFDDQTCPKGWMEDPLVYIQSYGLGQASKYPYDPLDSEGKPKPCNKQLIQSNEYKSGRSMIMTSFNIHNENCDHLIVQLRIRPLMVSMTTKYFQFYSKGVYNYPDANEVSHAVVLVGFHYQVGYLVKNSWGTQWGLNGYAILEENVGACRFAMYPYVDDRKLTKGPCYYRKYQQD